MKLNYFFVIALCAVLIQARDFKRSKVNFGVDNLINRIELNENEVFVKKIDLSNTDTTKELDLVLFPGDELAFKVSKEFNLFNSQPGFVCTIDYVDQLGNKKQFNSGADWKCGNKAPQVLDQISSTRNWKSWKNTDVDSSAYVIWETNKPKETICKFIIPKL